ncbi:MAG TPA: GNAT family N-acetyltransferase [Acidobacteriaceae bacterium]
MSFEQKRVALPIRFGPKTLFRIPFKAHYYVGHFTDLRNPIDLPETASEAVIFPSVPSDGNDHVPLRIHDGRIFYSPKQFPHYLADLTTDFETYLSSFGSKSKSTLRRKVRKFEELAGPGFFRQYKSADELRTFYALARELSKRTYQEKLLGHGLPEDLAFQERMIDLAQADEVRAYSLHLGDIAVAYLYCPVRDGVLYYDFLGYDPAQSGLSAGAVLQYLAFESLFAEKKFRLFDFEEGEGQHKRQFSTTCIQCSNLMVFRPGLKSWAYIAMEYACHRSTSLALRLLDKLKLRTRVRQSLRSGNA